MIVLRYPAKDAAVANWIEHLQSLVLAHRTEVDTELLEPVLMHSDAEYRGTKEISSYLDQLQQESGAWWYCSWEPVEKSN